jgi:predicted kinase
MWAWIMTSSFLTRPMLTIFSGLPGTGKTTLSCMLAKEMKAAYLRIDTVEQALRDLCSLNVYGEGYGLSYRIAADNLRLGMDVVADCCNPIELTRHQWQQVAIEAQASCINIEVVCSDEHEHRHRVETRVSSVPTLRLPTWNEVRTREYQAWTVDRIIIDTAHKSEAECMGTLLSKLSSAVKRNKARVSGHVLTSLFRED